MTDEKMALAIKAIIEHAASVADNRLIAATILHEAAVIMIRVEFPEHFSAMLELMIDGLRAALKEGPAWSTVQ